jgi:3-hydroxybutyryl-CoA dehydrogenase
MRVAVLGTGVMGPGVAQVAAQAGYDVYLWARSSASAERGQRSIEQGLARLVKKEKLGVADAAAIAARVKPTTVLEEVKDAQLVIEAIAEELEPKRALFERLGELCEPGTILASNTSSLSITRLAAFTGRPEQFVGLHFFNPVPAMALVEIVRGLATSDATAAFACDFARQLGKEPIPARDMPGFVVNRVLMPMMNEAARALEQGVAGPEQIDACMKLGCNHPMGPLALADLVGLDVVAAILDSLHAEFGQPHYRPCMEIRRRVEAGWLGRKTGRGFFDYSS